MIDINKQACDGCGQCVDMCPNGALQLVGGVAQLDQSLCQECETCVEVCPTGALLSVIEPVEMEEHTIALSTSLPVMKMDAPIAESRRDRGSSWMGAALQFMVHEAIPEAVRYLWESCLQRRDAPGAPAGGMGFGGRGRGRKLHRRQGGSRPGRGYGRCRQR